MSKRERDSFNEINITPLTDIFLVLLIIMMVIAPLLDQQGLNLAVPNNVEIQDLNKDVKLIVISVGNDDKYYDWNNEDVPVEYLEQFIKKSIKDKPDGLLIQADAESSHGAVVKLMDIARNSGVTNISISQM